MKEKSREIFGNKMPQKVYRKAVKSKKKFQKKLESFIFATHLNLKLKNEKWHRLHLFLKGQEIIHRKLW